MTTNKGFAFFAAITVTLFAGHAFAASAGEIAKQLEVDRGIIAVVDLPDGEAKFVIDLVEKDRRAVYFQSADASQVAAVRKAAEKAGLLGTCVFAETAPLASIHLGKNVADALVVAEGAKGKVSDKELLRVLRPLGIALVGTRKLVKPIPAGIDEWSHPYHGPDNNPQSTDQLVKGSFRTQFLADPKFSPMPEQSVAAGGRIFKVMGHIAHKANQNPWLNTLLCINAYNGTILWKRPSPPGFMIHRNTMIATEDTLLMGDHESCKIFDARTGKILEEITIPKGITDGPTWKWMAQRDGVLYGLVGFPEIKVDTQKSTRRGLGHWPWAMWQGHDYKDPRTAFGYGRTLVAIDMKSKKPIWNYRDKDFLDARAICMNGDKIYCYAPEKFIACFEAYSGKLLWKNSDKDLLDAIGSNGRAQHYITGYATTCYMKCTDDFLFFAGPHRQKLVAASAKDGKLAWTYPVGNLQLVLRDDAVYAAGPQKVNGVKLDYKTGKTLAEFPARRACTRATGGVDSIFYRASGGTVRVFTETNTAQHIAPMRPPCQDGVLISNGHLYWGPWMCGCQLSLYGNICLGPATKLSSDPAVLYKDALVTGQNITKVQPLGAKATDWVSYRGDNARTDETVAAIPADVQLQWQATIATNAMPTAPVAAGGLVFVADRTGTVRALDANGKVAWKAYTAGPIYYPPAVAGDRLFVGSADGRVYTYEARTGRFLWSFRVAPQDRRIPVYETLISRWPVAGGVVVKDGTVYAAAGLGHYDGTYVVALDAVTGKLKTANTTSGTISEQVDNGISMQGNLTIQDGELRFLAGGVYETARYDLKTLKCLNTPLVQVTSQFRTAFYPYYPAYGKYVSLDHTCGDGSNLCHDASYEGSQFTNLTLHAPLPAGVAKAKREVARWGRGGKHPGKVLWQDKSSLRFTSFVVGQDQLLATGHPDAKPEERFLTSIDIKAGRGGWSKRLPADAVKGGTAIDSSGRIYVSLENGQLLCFGPVKK